jgi:hypothetical protein
MALMKRLHDHDVRSRLVEHHMRQQLGPERAGVVVARVQLVVDVAQVVVLQHRVEQPVGLVLQLHHRLWVVGEVARVYHPPLHDGHRVGVVGDRQLACARCHLEVGFQQGT